MVFGFPSTDDNKIFIDSSRTSHCDRLLAEIATKAFAQIDSSVLPKSLIGLPSLALSA